MRKKLLSILLVLCMLVSMLAFSVPASAVTTPDGQSDVIQGGAILHCFDWSYNAIKAALPDIAASGYTAVQTSPVQQPKDYNPAWTNTIDDEGGQWWKLYQPLGLRIAPTDEDGAATSWLGTKAELTALCTEAETYGIKVIVDIVANHLANSSDGGTYNHLSPDVDPVLRNALYYHTEAAGIDYEHGNRYNLTHNHMGMPDLNTGNSAVQQMVLSLLEECIDCGVDGFRFDAAKHIELPDDPAAARSDFWRFVINGARDYAVDCSLPELFIYGEILGDPGPNTSIDQYTNFMAVTDNTSGNRSLSAAHDCNAGMLAVGTYDKDTVPSNCVLWVESHDTYLHNESTYADDQDIINAWAITGARADSTSLFLARPNATMGLPSTDTTWKSKAVAEVNNFKNAYDGTQEYLSYADNVTYIERGIDGVVISKLDGAGHVSLTAHRMQDGDYVDYVTGNPFRVYHGVISGNVGSSGVAVVRPTGGPGGADSDGIIHAGQQMYLYPTSAWDKDGALFEMYLFDNNNHEAWVSMDNIGNGCYHAEVPTANGIGEWTGVIFCRMNPNGTPHDWSSKWNQTVNLFPDTGKDCFTITGGSDSDYNGAWSRFHKTIYAVNNAGWEDVYLYYWIDGSSTNPIWPGTPLSAPAGYLAAGNNVYCFDELPGNVTGIIFNNGSGGSGNQTANITSGITDGASWTISSGGATENTPSFYRVKFNINDGEYHESNGMADQVINYGDTVTLNANTYTRPGYIFTGWNTRDDGNGVAYEDQASVLDLTEVPYGVVDLFAQWKEALAVTIADGITGGTVSADKAETYAGDTVILTVAPESGFALSSLTVAYSDGTTDYTLTPDQVQGAGHENEYSFRMPRYPVTVSAVFSGGDAPAYFGCIVETRPRLISDNKTDLMFRMRFQYNHSHRGTNGDTSDGSYEITEVGYSITYTSGSEHTVPEHATDKVYYSNSSYFEIAVVISGIPYNFYGTEFHINPYLKYSDGNTVTRIDASTFSVSVNDVDSSN